MVSGSKCAWPESVGHQNGTGYLRHMVQLLLLVELVVGLLVVLDLVVLVLLVLELTVPLHGCGMLLLGGR